MPNGIFTLTQVNQAVRQGAWTGFIAPTWVEYLVVAGGGGGGGNGGGGGAGGLLTGVVTVLAGTSYTVTVGSGGAGGTASLNPGSNGVASVFGSISSSGGGGGGGYNVFSSVVTSGSAGGSGGGGGRQYDVRGGTGGQGTGGQGNKGGDGSKDYASGGGGGAGTIGLNAFSERAGNGGSGIASAISGTVTTYAGGGAGTTQPSVNPPGSVGGVGGGGGPSPTYSAAAGTGSSNSGGGGGGGWGADGGAGGSGVVIVRYPGTVQYFTGGTLSYANGYVIHTFNASGTLAPTTPTPYVANDYQISRSLRFNSADSTTLSRTPASATNRKTWTWSAWVKKSAAGETMLFSVYVDGSNFGVLYFNSSDVLQFQTRTGGAVQGNLFTQAVFRDPSAWYHIVMVWDSTKSAVPAGISIAVNGVQQALTTSVAVTTNYDGWINSANDHRFGSLGASSYANGYLTEVNFIDGQALTPSSFGYYDFNTGVWAPTKFVGVYGTNGFYLNFSDNSNTTAATLGRDYSGNSNNWTPNNFSVSAGAGNDSLVDVPTNWGVDTGVGGSVRGNYCTLNPLDQGSTVVLSNGNLNVSITSGLVSSRATFGVASGKWYWEATCNYFHISPSAYGYAQSTGDKWNNNSSSSYGASWTTGDVIGVALDLDAGTLVFYKNGTSQGTAFSGLSGTFFPMMFVRLNDGVYSFNFGQRPFAYTAPSDFKALNTQNLPTPTIGATAATQAGKYYNAVLWTGNGSVPRAISGLGFQPDFVWGKARDIAFSNILYDSVRGTGTSKSLVSNSTNAEGSFSSFTNISSFDADGFTVGVTGSTNVLNDSGRTFVGWGWRASNATAVTNTAGTVNSAVSANTTSGFSIALWTGTGVNATFGHGLGVAPAMVIMKNRTQGGAGYNWAVYHRSLPDASYFLDLNTTSAQAINAGIWNSVAPTATVVTVGTARINNGDLNVAYCFAEVPGYSRFGSYVGNSSSNGPFVFCGFRPAYVMVKLSSTGATADWIVEDGTRNPSNVVNGKLSPNTDGAEFVDASAIGIDFLSNGFKIRGTDGSVNTANTYIFAAFASAPFKYALAR
jgi:hypothetical protein